MHQEHPPQHKCERPEDFLKRFGDDRVDSALEVMGQAFLHNPYAARHPLYFGQGVFQKALYENGRLSHDTVSFLAQGPLPLSIRGAEYMSQFVAFGIEGVPDRHEALCVLLPDSERNSSRETLYVATEDHVNMVVQSMGAGSVWENFDQALVSVIKDGNGILLLPECMANMSDQYKYETAYNIAAMVGIHSVEMLPDIREQRPKNTHILEQIRRHGNPQALNRGFITKSEYVLLPWSDTPFTHLEVKDRTQPGDIHHLWTFGDIVGESNVSLRPHSACSSSEVFGANNCDCPDQLDATFQIIANQGQGMLMYLDQEARGHGAVAKVGTWGFNIGHKHDLFKAFHAAGYTEDARTFRIVAEMLQALGVKSIELLSNNLTVKHAGLANEGIEITGRQSISIAPRSVYCEIDHHAKKHTRKDGFSDVETIALSDMKLRRH